MRTIERQTKILVVAGLFSALPCNAFASPLFDSQETLDVIIEAPIGELSSERNKHPEFPGTVRYTDASGADHAVAVTVGTRGRSRLEVCDNPPLRLTFNPDENAGTVFEGQEKLKLVRQCMRSGKSRDWVYMEFGIYRAYNVITDYSYRVRQLNVAYREPGARPQRDIVQPAFFIEDENDMARRLNRKRIRPPQVEADQMLLTETTHNLLFQYLIGNTDFAVKRGPSGEGCCHNGTVITEKGRQQDWIIVPYDFDYAGIINADYAMPHEKLPIKRVTTRLYRGYCWQGAELGKSIALFNQKRSQIEAALLPAEISQSRLKRASNYLQQFYEIVNDPQKLQENLLDKCMGPDSLEIRERTVSPRVKKTP